MSLRIDTSDATQAKITFILPVDEPPGEVSVVGSFNNWTPGDRYLGCDNVWVDEPDADQVTAMGSLLNPLPMSKKPVAQSPATD
jgi:hypothetical protein